MAKKDIPEDTFSLDESAAKLDGGVTLDRASWGTVAVSSAPGKALNEVTVSATFKTSPEVVFAVLTYPDNSKLFRDVRTIGGRRVITKVPGYKCVEVEHLNDIQLLWIKKTFSTLLRVEEHSSDPNHCVMSFKMIRSDVLAEFEGRWDVMAVKEHGKVVATNTEMQQKVMPRGLPAVFKHLPIVGSLLRRSTLNSVERMLEDIDVAVNKITAAMSTGRSLSEVMRDLCGPCDEYEQTCGDVASSAAQSAAAVEQADKDTDAVTRGLAAVSLASNKPPARCGTTPAMPQPVPAR